MVGVAFEIRTVHLLRRHKQELHYFRHPNRLCILKRRIWDSAVTIVTKPQAGRLRNHGSIPGGADGLFSYAKRPTQLWALPSALFSGNLELFFW